MSHKRMANSRAKARAVPLLALGLDWSEFLKPPGGLDLARRVDLAEGGALARRSLLLEGFHIRRQLRAFPQNPAQILQDQVFFSRAGFRNGIEDPHPVPPIPQETAKLEGSPGAGHPGMRQTA